jgi:predicted RNase H-like nuclease (RuvC/YqgF family)
MKAYGYDWHQTTVGRIEAAQRPLRLNEAVDLAALFGVSLQMLLTRAQRELDAEDLLEQIRKLRMRITETEKELKAATQEWEETQTHERIARGVVRRIEARVSTMHGQLAALVDRDRRGYPLAAFIDPTGGVTRDER